MTAILQTEIGEQALVDLRSNKALAADLAKKYGDVTAIGSTKEYELVRVAIGEHRTLRLDVEKRRKELVDGAVRWQRDVNAVAKEITQTIETSEDRLKAIKDAEDARKERAKREKAEAERKAIEDKLRAEAEAREAIAKAEREKKEKELEEARAAIRAEAERIERESAERERILAEREAEFAAERARVEAERKKLEEERLRLEREEADRQARIREAKEAAAKAEAEKAMAALAEAQAAERAKLEAEMAEVTRPDREKLLAFAKRIRAMKAPVCQTEQASALVVLAMKRILETAEYIEDAAGTFRLKQPTQAGE